jgi:hypothetical protein
MLEACIVFVIFIGSFVLVPAWPSIEPRAYDTLILINGALGEKEEAKPLRRQKVRKKGRAAFARAGSFLAAGQKIGFVQALTPKSAQRNGHSKTGQC